MMPLRCRFDRFSLASGHDPIVVSVPLSLPLWVPLRCLFDRFSLAIGHDQIERRVVEPRRCSALPE